MTEVIMPKMGDGMEEGTLLEWLKKEGEKVKSGEIIGTIQTDKATLELEAPGSGILGGFLIKEGDTVPVGDPIAAILKDGEALPAGWGGGNGAPAAAPLAAQVVEAPLPSVATAPTGGGRIKASPLARKIAEENGISLAGISGTGPGGRVVEKDVREYLESGVHRVAAPSVQPTIAAAPSAPPVALPLNVGQDREVPLSRLRQIIAQRTQQSKQQAPHFYVTVEVDVERILELREQFKAEDAAKVSVNDFVVRACALALVEMPEVNATFAGDKIVQYGSVHVGIAAAIDDGLLVPVIKNAQSLTLTQIAAASKDLVKRARDGKLLPDEMSGSTFSISNMGMLDVDAFAAIINQPNAAIVAIGSARKKVVVNDDDEIEVRQRMNITGSFDHRVLDGAVGARFMNVVKGFLQNPTRLLS